MDHTTLLFGVRQFFGKRLGQPCAAIAYRHLDRFGLQATPFQGEKQVLLAALSSAAAGS
jgi:hypothetical protein